MNSFNQILAKAAQQSASATMQPGDYLEGGLLFCGRCHTAKQARIPIPGGDVVTVSCLCQCATAARDARIVERHQQEEMDELERLRSAGIVSQRLRDATFENADGQNETVLDKLRRYVSKWPEMREKNIGLLLYGAVGTGKSYGAACIANALIAQRIPAFMSNFSGILNGMGETFEKNSYISSLMRYPLLILDDFGVERSTEYSLEQIFNVIDSRYRTGKPLIVTTNLPLSDLKNPADTAHRRIYDRLLEMCVPISFGTEGRRAERAKEKLHDAVRLLNE